MKNTVCILALVVAALPSAWAQDRIYRCGNEYTNNATQAKERGCRLVEGGNVTVLQGGRAPNASGAAAASTGSSASSPASAPKVSAADQRARDADARAILEAELRKAEAKLADLRKEYNDGSPQRTALEMRNPQGYIERTAELKASVTRAEADVAGIQRELARLNK
jgi:hypothetical protein